jgi:hypothetical protein
MEAASSSSAGLPLSLTSSAVSLEATDWFPQPDGGRAISVFRAARSGVFPTWTWECGWFALQICATSRGASRSSAGRDCQRQQLVPGRSPVRFVAYPMQQS